MLGRKSSINVTGYLLCRSVKSVNSISGHRPRATELMPQYGHWMCETPAMMVWHLLQNAYLHSAHRQTSLQPQDCADARAAADAQKRNVPTGGCRMRKFISHIPVKRRELSQAQSVGRGPYLGVPDSRPSGEQIFRCFKRRAAAPKKAVEAFQGAFGATSGSAAPLQEYMRGCI